MELNIQGDYQSDFFWFIVNGLNNKNVNEYKANLSSIKKSLFYLKQNRQYYIWFSFIVLSFHFIIFGSESTTQATTYFLKSQTRSIEPDCTGERC